MRLSLKRRATAVQERGEEQAPRPFADRCAHVRTRFGGKAHLQHPEHPERVLCGRVTPHWERAEPGMDVCSPCKDAAQLEDERRAAS